MGVGIGNGKGYVLGNMKRSGYYRGGWKDHAFVVSVSCAE